MQYHGFELTSNCKLTEDGRWTHEVLITRHRNTEGRTTEQNFSTERTFESKNEADAAAVKFGRGIIDGAHPNLTVDNL